MEQHSDDHDDSGIDDGTASYRNAARDSLLLAARLRIDGGATIYDVRVRNLSAGGLMLELPTDIAKDTPVEVEVRGIGWISGTVAWTTAGRAGMAFNKSIDPMRARKPVGQGAHTPSFTKPIITKR